MSVDVAHEPGFVRLTLAEPGRRNPLSRAVLAELAASVRAYGPGAGTLVLTGAGGTFSAGADLRELTGTAADTATDDAVAAAGAALRGTDALVVAAVAGPCIGAAVALVLDADVVIAEPSAYFQVPAVRLGLLYDPAAVERWHRALPAPLLRRLLLLGEPLDAETARAAGLVTEIAADARAAAERRAAAHAATPPTAFAATKRLLRALDDGTYDRDHWSAVRHDLLDTPERRAALAARTARRTT